MEYHSFLKSITLVVLTQGVLHFLTAGKMLHLVSKVHCAVRSRERYGNEQCFCMEY